MAQVKVSDLPAASGLSTSDTVITNRSGVTSRTTAGAFTDTMTGFTQAGTGAVARTVQDKCRDIISVLDFMTAAQIADVRARTYLVDVASPLQSALNYADSIGGAWLYAPYGGYSIGTRLQIEDNTRFTGAGSLGTTIKLASTIANTAAQAFKTETGVGVHTNITIEDLEIDGNNSNITPAGNNEGEGSLIYLDQVEGATVRNVYCHDALENGMYVVNSSANIVVEGCNISSNGEAGSTAGRGIVFGVSPTKFRIVGNTCNSNFGQGIVIQSEGGAHAEDFVVMGNVCKSNGGHGIDITDNVISSVTAVDIYIRRAVVQGNTCQGNTGNGIRLSENVTTNGLGADAIMEDIAVTGNVCHGNTANGILVQASNNSTVNRVVITGNSCSGNTSEGIEINGSGVNDTRIGANNLLNNSAPIANTGTRTVIDSIVLAQSAIAASGAADTNENTLATITIPATMMGTNGRVVITSQWSCTNNANAKTARTKFGGTSYQDFNLASTTGGQSTVVIANRNSAASQTGFVLGITDAATVTQASDQLVTTKNTGAAVTILLTGQKGTAGDTITLESYKVELFLG